MASARSRTGSNRLVISFSAVALCTVMASTASAQATPDLFTKVDTLTLSDGTSAVGPSSLAGDTAVVASSGSAHVFEREPGGDDWAHTATLVPSGGEELTGLLRTDGQTIVVGVAGDTPGGGYGPVYVFQGIGDSQTWTEVAKLTGDADGKSFGASVAVGGTTVVVGAPGTPQSSPTTTPIPSRQGRVYVFEQDQGGPNTWGEVARFDGDLPGPGPGHLNVDRYGAFVALDGDTLVVSRHRLAGGIVGVPGVDVFSRAHGNSDGWSRVTAFLVLSPPVTVEAVPIGLDISGNRIASSISFLSAINVVATRVFQQDHASTEWREIFGTGGCCSTAARISGDLLVTLDSPRGTLQGSTIRVHSRNQDGADQWGEVAFPPVSGWIAVSGDTILSSGVVYVADTDRDGRLDGADPCPRDPLNNVEGGCTRNSAAYSVLDDLITLGEVTTESQGHEFHVTATFTNTSDTPIGNPFLEIIELTGGNVLVNADAGPGATGATLSPDVGDGILSAGESTTVTFVIGLETHEPFRFFVSVRGEVAP